MNEIYKPIIDGDKPKKRESWSPFLDKYEKEMVRIAKLEDQIARIEKNIDEKIKEVTHIRIKLEEQMARIEKTIEDKKTKKLKKEIKEMEENIAYRQKVIKEMEENIAYRQKDIQETQVRADSERTKHDLSIRKLENCDPNRAGNA